MGGDPVSFGDPMGLWVDMNPKSFNYNDQPDPSRVSWMDLASEYEFHRNRKSIFALSKSGWGTGGGGGGSPYSSVDPVYDQNGQLIGWQSDNTDWFATGGYNRVANQQSNSSVNPASASRRPRLKQISYRPGSEDSYDGFTPGPSRKYKWVTDETGMMVAGFYSVIQQIENTNFDFLEHFIGPGLILLGQPIDRLKPIGALGSKPGSSIASKSMSKAFPQKFTSVLGKRTGTRISQVVGTNTIGRAFGRFVPLLGWGLTIYDVWENRVEINEFVNGARRLHILNSYKIDGTWNTEWHVR
jgi:hypothetical protein